jgi:phage gp36-like protein
MFYCTAEDIEIQLGKEPLIQLTNDNCEQNTIDTVVCEEAILYSSTLIDGYLRGRYNLPLNTHFPLLRVVAMDLSIYRLYSRRIMTEIPEVVCDAYKNAIKTLENLQKGIITLETQDNQTLQNGQYRTNKTELDRLFNKGRLSEY